MSMKRTPPNWWVRLKSGGRTGLTAFATSVGLSSGVITAVSSTGTYLSVGAIEGVGILCVAAGVVSAWIRGRMKLLPDSFIDDMGLDGSYTCEFCSNAQFKEACDMTEPYYKKWYIPYESAALWRLKNPKGFVAILNAEGTLCACFGVIAIASSFMDQFVAGKLTEKQLDDSDVCSFEQSKMANRIYISGVVVKNPSTFMGSKRARVMLWALFHYLKDTYGLRRSRTLFALAVTDEAERLLKKLNFQLHTPGYHRVDSCNLYSLPFNKQSMDNLMVQIGDFSPMCKYEALHRRA